MKKISSICILCTFILFGFSPYGNAAEIYANIISVQAKNAGNNNSGSIQAVSAPKPLSFYSTPLQNSSKNRIYNINLAAKKLDRCKVKPNGTFSFNHVVGDRTTNNGFRSAAIIVGDKYDEGIGGGVCQLSSTIYNAVDMAGMKIIERHRHTIPVSYVPNGRDATVCYGCLDFKFKNTKEYPIEIRAQVKGKKVYVSIWKAAR